METVGQPTVKTVHDLEINVLYLLTQVFEVMMRDFERRISKEGIEFWQEKKRQFNRLMKSVRDIYTQFDILYEDIIISAEPVGWQELDEWQADANAVARLVLLYADRCCPRPENSESLFKFLEGLSGDGVVGEEALGRFMMKK